MSDKERLELMMLYAGIVSFRFHPGWKGPLGYADCMVEALKAYNIFRSVASGDGGEMWRS